MKRLNLLLLIVIFMGFTGCDFLSRTWPSITDRYPFRNYYVDGDGVLAVSRVLVMPFSNSTDWADASREVTAVSKSSFPVTVQIQPSVKGWQKAVLSTTGTRARFATRTAPTPSYLVR